MDEYNIYESRKNIDEIDEQIMSLLDKRLNEVKKIGDYKKINNIPIENNIRQNEILDAIKKRTSNKDHNIPISKIYKKIFEQSIEVEEK